MFVGNESDVTIEMNLREQQVSLAIPIAVGDKKIKRKYLDLIHLYPDLRIFLGGPFGVKDRS